MSSYQKLTALVAREITEPVSALEFTKPRRTKIWVIENSSADWNEKYSAMLVVDNKKGRFIAALGWRTLRRRHEFGLPEVRLSPGQGGRP